MAGRKGLGGGGEMRKRKRTGNICSFATGRVKVEEQKIFAALQLGVSKWKNRKTKIDRVMVIFFPLFFANF